MPRGTGVEHGEDVRVGQPGRHPDLPVEPVAADLDGDLGPEDLEGHLAPVAEVLRQEDHGHAAFAELSFDGVAAGEGGGEAVREVGHGERKDATGRNDALAGRCGSEREV